jgi:hypothetical protein
VRGTVDFFMSQSETATIDRILITGGGSQTDGLAAAIAGNTQAAINTIDPFVSLSLQGLALEPGQLEQARASSTTAIGLALWPFESPVIRLSVLPDEVAAAKRARRLLTAAACGVAGFAALLGVVGVGEMLRVHSAQHGVHAAQARVNTLTQQVAVLQAATAVHGQAQARAALVQSALKGDVDWVRFLGQLATVMPSNLSLTNFQGTRTNVTGGPSAPSSSGSKDVGTLSYSVKGNGGLPAAKSWLIGLQQDPNVDGPWVTGIDVVRNGGAVQFTSSSGLTTVADSNRDKAVQP